MKKKFVALFVIGIILLGLSVAAIATGWNAKPKVICVMQNPTTGERVEMFKEIWFKVPADYDEKKHIESWKAEQRSRGYTVELTK
jgi:hypothetical protein